METSGGGHEKKSSNHYSEQLVRFERIYERILQFSVRGDVFQRHLETLDRLLQELKTYSGNPDDPKSESLIQHICSVVRSLLVSVDKSESWRQKLEKRGCLYQKSHPPVEATPAEIIIEVPEPSIEATGHEIRDIGLFTDAVLDVLDDASLTTTDPVESTTDRPDPEKHTRVSFWTNKDGTLNLKSQTNGRIDGKAEFKLVHGSLTKQSRFIWLVASQHPKPVRIADVIQQVYTEEADQASKDAVMCSKLYNRIRALVSDIQAKLAKAGIDPNILTIPRREYSSEDQLGLKVRWLEKSDNFGLNQF